MTRATPVSSAGRPKDAEKHAAILAAARRLFFERGPTAVTIDAVAAAAAVSRMTVYGHFGDKDALFAAVIAQQARTVGQALAKISQRATAASAGSASMLRSDLIAFGIDLTTFLLQPDLRAFNRLMEGSAASYPKLAKIWADNGPRAVVGVLADQLSRASAAGLIAAPEPAMAARHLTGLFKSIETSGTASGLSPLPTAPEIERHVTECVAIFLRGYAPPSFIWPAVGERNDRNSE